MCRASRQLSGLHAAGRSDPITDPSGNSYMTAHDFFLLSATFGGFVIVPALLLWGFARLVHRKHTGRRGPGIWPDVDSTDASSGDETKESARSGKANEFPSLAQHRQAPPAAAISGLADEGPAPIQTCKERQHLRIAPSRHTSRLTDDRRI